MLSLARNTPDVARRYDDSGHFPAWGDNDAPQRWRLARAKAPWFFESRCISWCAGRSLDHWVPLASGALVIAYSRAYFGTWYPQYRAQVSGAFVAPDFGHLLTIYQQMFLYAQSGLIPWAPLMLLAPVGLVLLARRHPREAGYALLRMVGLLSAFLSAAFAPHVNQADALPARITVESLPLFALCVTALVAHGWPALRTGVRKLAMGNSLRRLTIAQSLAACCCLACLILLAADIWLTLVAQFGPALLHPSDAGVRLATAYPHLLPGWWFGFFSRWS